MNACTNCGLALVFLGFSISFITLILRAILIPRQESILKGKMCCFCIMIGFSILSIPFAIFGYSCLIRSPINEANDYSLIIATLSLLSVGVIAGFFRFTFGEARKENVTFILSNAVAISFNTIFYFLFGLVCYCIGRSTHTETIGDVSFFVPAIMGVILVANTLFDYWDYVKIE